MQDFQCFEFVTKHPRDKNLLEVEDQGLLNMVEFSDIFTNLTNIFSNNLVSILSKMMYNSCVPEIILNNHNKQHLYFFLKNLTQKLELFSSQLHLT